MDCAALQSQLSELRSLHQTFQSDFNHMNETGTGNINLKSSQNAASSKTDEMLEQYLDDFIEHNPDLFLSWHQIESLEIDDSVFTLASLPNNQIFLSTNGSHNPPHLKTLQRNSNASTEYSESSLAQSIADIPTAAITYLAVSPDEETLFCTTHDDKVYAKNQTNLYDVAMDLASYSDGREAEPVITFLSNRSVLISGGYSIYKYDGSTPAPGSSSITPLFFGPPFSTYEDTHGNTKHQKIVGITPLSDGRALIASDQGELVIFDEARQSHQYPYHKVHLDYPPAAGLSSITTLPNGKILAGGNDSNLYELTLLPDDHCTFTPILSLIEDGITGSFWADQPNQISAILPLPDSNHIIISVCDGHRNSLFFELRPATNGQGWEGVNLAGSSTSPRYFRNPKSNIAVLSSGELITVGISDTNTKRGVEASSIQIYSRPIRTLSTIKQSLSQLAGRTE